MPYTFEARSITQTETFSKPKKETFSIEKEESFPYGWRFVTIYEQAGIEEYLIIHPHSDKAKPFYEIWGYRLIGGKYQRINPDERGRLLSQTTNVLFGVHNKGRRLRLKDAQTGKWLLTAQESEARRLKAEKRTIDAKKRAQAAEERAQAETKARLDAEKRTQELEKRVRELEAKNL